MIRYLPVKAGMLALLIAIAGTGLFFGRDSTMAANFFNPCAAATLAASTANAPSDITGTFGIGVDPATCGRFPSAIARPGEYNSAGLIYFTPPGWKVATDADIPDGATVGTFKSEAVLGLLDNGCNTVVNVNFTLLDGTIDRSKSVDALPPGSKDRLSNLAKKDANGVPAVASGWPTYLNDTATKDGMDLSKLIARFVGVDTTDVTGTTIILQFLVFQPGATVSNQITLDPALGYPAVTVLQDPTQAGSAQDPISDFCAPLWTQSTLQGTVGGTTFRGNPGDGVYDFVTWVLPAPDANGDGIENALDPCPSTAKPGWDPRATVSQGQPGDQDADGIPDACDPFPTVPSLHVSANGVGKDEDGDGWQNRGDNCPLVPNGAAQANVPGVGNQTDTDQDGIGDACDPNPTVKDGQGPPVCLVTQVTIGSGGTAPADPTALAPCNPNAVPPAPGQPAAATNTPAPTPTFIPGTTTRPTNAPVAGSSGIGGVGGGPAGGIGSLAPAGTSIPAWAAMLAVLGALGLCLGFGLMGARIWRRR
jgi:Thrombospondin type 3 repeat